MNLTLQEKFDIMLLALEAIGSYETCDCGCPRARQPRLASTRAYQVWAIANDALKKIGHDIKEFEYDETSSTYRQSSQQDSIQ